MRSGVPGGWSERPWRRVHRPTHGQERRKQPGRCRAARGGNQLRRQRVVDGTQGARRQDRPVSPGDTPVSFRTGRTKKTWTHRSNRSVPPSLSEVKSPDVAPDARPAELIRPNFLPAAVRADLPAPSRAEAEWGRAPTLLSYIGENPGRRGPADTPRRVVEAFDELYQGDHQRPAEVLDSPSANCPATTISSWSAISNSPRNASTT